MYVKGLKQTTAEALVQARDGTLDRRHPERSEGPQYSAPGPTNLQATNNTDTNNSGGLSFATQRVESGASQTSRNTQNLGAPGLASETWAEAPLNLQDNYNFQPRHPFHSVEDLAHRVPQLTRRDLNQLARIGALNQLTAVHHRRDAIWQAEQAGRLAGPLLTSLNTAPPDSQLDRRPKAEAEKPTLSAKQTTPLRQMSTEDRLVADYAGTGLSIDHHPMAFRRAELRAANILSAAQLHRAPNGRRVSAAGCVIARQRPGTALGFIFLSMEDETGIANIIIHPDLYDRDRLLITREKFLLVTGKLQNQDGVIHIKGEVVTPLRAPDLALHSHDFH